MKKKALNVLFIEDSEEDVELAVMELARDGFDIRWRRVDSEHGLREILSTWQPDIILSDHSMPRFDGIAALEITREMTPDIPFIFVSGTIGEENAIESIHRGATDYVLKDNLRRLSTSINRAINDADERHRAQQIENERSRLAAILEATSDLVFIANPDETIQYVNIGARKLLQLGDSLANLSIRDLHAEWPWNLGTGELPGSLSRDGIWQGYATLVATDGTRIPTSQVMISHPSSDGGQEYFSFIARDLRDLEAYEQQIQYLANYDSLTGLPNRALLSNRTEQTITYCRQSREVVALLMININRFKLVNDGYGQDAGDALLKEFAQRLSAAVRDCDIAARLSADNFAVLATGLTGQDGAMVLIREIQDRIHGTYVVGGNPLNLNTSIGVSVFPRDGDSFTHLLQNADIAMHRAKQTLHQANVQFYAPEMTKIASEQVRIENGLRKAISRNELELHYQPQICISDGTIVGVEALMRWQHPELGLVGPERFIPAAEASGWILPMSEWALLTACQQVKKWDSVVGRGLRVAVNISALQFRNEGFADTVSQVLMITGLAPQRLEIELTESILIEDHHKTMRTLNKLSGLGVQIALDDFGTGYSNLSYLSRLPIHCLKIDKSFVQRSLSDRSDGEIVRAIIALADNLGLRVVAEGIETPEQLSLLRQHRCDEGQGFLFSRPQCATDISALLPKFQWAS